jgi:hypothetical protein
VSVWLAWATWAAWATRPGAPWLAVLPALLPLASLAPWTGWVVFEEFDLLLLGAAAGGYARRAWQRGILAHGDVLPARERWIIAALAVWTLLGLVRGMLDAGFDPAALHAYQSQADPLNAWRIAKSALLMLLLYPLVREQFIHDVRAAFDRLASGMVAGSALLCLLIAWERAALPGLTDWDVPYRTTAWFWDMHVGGAAIDAYLALTTPFVAWAVWSARRWWRWLAAAALAVLWAYACLTTYARGAYLGAAVSLFVLGLRLPVGHGSRLARAARLSMMAAGTLVPVWLAIDAAGYLAGVLVLLAAGGLMALSFHRSRRGRGEPRPASLRGLALGALALLLLFEAAAVVGPDSYMWSRMTISGRDGVGRFTHWLHGVALLQSPADAAIGLGLGRVPSHYDRRWPREQFSGQAGWEPASGQGGRHLRLSGPRTQDHLGGLFGITQRVPMASRYTASLSMQAASAVELLVRVCESHLLYDRACQAEFVRIEAGDDPQAWRQVRLDLVGMPLSVGRAWAPRQAVMTISVTNAGAVAAIDRVALQDESSRSLLRNGDFDAGLAHWWPTAQFHFLPWHVDNLYLELLVERGIIGLAMFLALVLTAWRAGAAHVGPGQAAGPAAWFASASLAGGLCVGLVSSLVDVPRVAWLMMLMMAVLLSVREVSPRAESAAPHSGAA